MDLEAKPSTIEIDGVWDIESSGWDTWLSMGALRADGQYTAFDCWSSPTGEREAVMWLLSQRGMWWSLGTFDPQWLLEWCAKLGISATAQTTDDGRPIVVRVDQGPTLADAWQLVRCTLEQLTRGTQWAKGSPVDAASCSCGIPGGCGGWCQVTKGMDPVLRRKLLEYMERDCRGLMYGLTRLVAFAQEHGLDLGNTIGSSTWAYAERALDLGQRDSRIYQRFGRPCYHGARNQLLRPLSAAGFEYDITWAYPASLTRIPLPWGLSRHWSGDEAHGAFMDSKPGIYDATVIVPEMHLPPLPVRREDGSQSYPWGRIQGRWVGPELDNAARAGCRIFVHRAEVWDEEKTDIFDPWLKRLWKLRQDFKDHPFFGPWLKNYGTALVGKLGARPIHSQLQLHPKSLRCCSCDREERAAIGGRCTGYCGAHKSLGPGDVYQVNRFGIGDSCRVVWASYANACTRIRWWQLATSHQEGKDVVYGNCDSLICEAPRAHVQIPQPGDWRQTGTYTDFHGLGPNVYGRILTPTGKSRALDVRASGLQLPRPHHGEQEADWRARLEQAWQQLQGGHLYQPARPLPVGRALARGGWWIAGEASVRAYSGGFGDRMLDRETGTTSPPRMESGR